MSSFSNVSLLNFSESLTRDHMQAALVKVQSLLGQSYQLHTGEAQVNKLTRTHTTSYNPAQPSQIIGYVAYASIDEVEQAIVKMHEGAKSWSQVPVEQRTALLRKLGQWMETQRYELAAWMILEVGKTWREADADVCEAIDFCHYYAEEMERLSQPRLTQIVAGEEDWLVYRPKGVAAIIAPWNFPLAILTGMTVAALVTGNTVLFKPAEQSVVIGALLAQGLTAAGFPADSYYFLPGKGEIVGAALVKDPRIDLITFTGSVEVGLNIIEQAAQQPQKGQRGVKKVIAEMGGKNALIVDEDADIDEAVAGCLHSAFGYQGQKCSALSRLLVHEKIYDAFLPRFIAAARSLTLGNPIDPDFKMGPVIDEKSQKRILKIINEAQQRLTTLYIGEAPSSGYYVPPAIFELTDIQDPLFQEEIFGPVVAVKKFSNLWQGITEANSVRFALTGGIYSRHPEHIALAKRHFEVGNLYINRPITGAVVQRHPFGGFKFSGVGSKAGGPDYLLQFLEPRTFAENTVRRGFAADNTAV